MKDFTCEACGRSFISDWDDEEAEKELLANFARRKTADDVRVCDKCYEMILTLMPELNQRN